MDLKVIQGQLEQKRGELNVLWDGIPKKQMPDGQKAPDMTTKEFKEFKDRHAEMSDLGLIVDGIMADNARKSQLELLEKGKEDAVNMGGKTQLVEFAKKATPGDLFLKSEGWAAGKDGNGRKFIADTDLDFDYAEFKTTMTTSAGYAPQVVRDGDIVPAIYRPPQLIDFLFRYQTESNSIKFMKQSTRTSGAAETSEASAFSEATLAYTETTDIISKIGHILPVTEEELEDDPVVKAMINMELLNMVDERLDLQVTVGNGTAPNLRGIFNATNILSQAQGGAGALTIIDTIASGIAKVQISGRARPNLVVLHNTDYWVLMKAKDSTGRYLMVNPGEMPKPMIWGLPIAQSEALTATNGLVLDTTYFPIAIRKGLTIGVSDSHSDFYAKNMLALRAYIRAGLKKRRDEAACKLTSLA